MIYLTTYLTLTAIFAWALMTIAWEIASVIVDGLTGLHRIAKQLDAEAAHYQELREREVEFNEAASDLQYLTEALERIGEFVDRGEYREAMHEIERTFEALDEPGVYPLRHEEAA